MLLIWEVETLAEYILQIKDLHFWYGEIHALKGISLNVEKNGVVSLLGANGAGKTTTLQYISGLIKGKHAGEIWYMGQRIDGKSAHTLSKIGIAQCIEGRRIFSQLSVRENLMMGAYLCRDNAKIKRNLEYVFTLFPRLLEREKQMGGTLSGGEQQMLAVGRALMQDPKLLMMDEPSLGLAPLLIEEVFRAIKKIKEDGLPILLVEQNSKAALQVADRGYVLEVGELVLEDAANLGGVKLGDTVVILGAGCIGLTTLAACKAMSASKIIVTDLFQNRLDKALEMGADYTINGREEDTLARVMELTGGMGAHIVFETAGNRVTAAQTESLTRRGGTIVIVGNVMGDTPMNFYKIAHKELVIKTVHRYRNVFPLAIQAISDGKIDIEKIASDCFDFDNGIAAFEKSLCEKQAVVKAILKME